MRGAKASRWFFEVFGSSASLSLRLLGLPKSPSIGFVGVWTRPLQNSNPGGLEAAIPDAFISFEASQNVVTPFGRPAVDLRPICDPPAAHLIVGGLSPPKATKYTKC